MNTRYANTTYPATASQWVLAALAMAGIAGLLVVGGLNEATGCRRDNTQHCIVVQHVWELGL